MTLTRENSGSASKLRAREIAHDRSGESSTHVTPRSRTNVHHALSARQAQIAALVARGKPNREIAHALWLSPRTVDAHLAALFNKLDVSSRSELTAALFILDAGHVIVPALQTSRNAHATGTAQIGRSAHHTLSARQTEIAALVSCGKSNREIARTLGRSPRTIDAHLVALFRKLNVRSRGELIAALSSWTSHLAVVPTRQTISKLHASRPVPVPRCELGGLSARQTQVAALVATGKSNREIGADLMLSSRTVATHVLALNNKLNVGSRGELIAALNRQHALVAQRLTQPDCAAAGKEPASATSVREGSSDYLGDLTDAETSLVAVL